MRARMGEEIWTIIATGERRPGRAGTRRGLGQQYGNLEARLSDEEKVHLTTYSSSRIESYFRSGE